MRTKSLRFSFFFKVPVIMKGRQNGIKNIFERHFIDPIVIYIPRCSYVFFYCIHFHDSANLSECVQ